MGPFHQITKASVCFRGGAQEIFGLPAVRQAVFQRICWEEPEKQNTRNCRAQKLSRSRAQWRGQERRDPHHNGKSGLMSMTGNQRQKEAPRSHTEQGAPENLTARTWPI